MRSKFALLSWLFITLSLALPVPLALAGSATWKSSPTSGDWLTANNWTPITVPNGASDIATFAVSNQAAIAITAPTYNYQFQLSGIQFNAGASAFTISLTNSWAVVEISGSGIVNGSGVVQSFSTIQDASLIFEQSAVAGDLVTIINQEGPNSGPGWTYFYDSSSASSSTIINEGCTAVNNYPGYTDFWDNATAANATIFNNGGTAWSSGGTAFYGTSSAGNAIITNTGIPNAGTNGGAGFEEHSTADHASLTNIQGGAVGFAQDSSAAYCTIISGGASIYGNPSSVYIADRARAGNAIMTATGGANASEQGARISFEGTSHAEDAALIARGGVNGGTGAVILFWNNSSGERARVEVSGNAQLDISNHAVPGMGIGSLEGNGSVLLGGNHLTIGSNNLSTTFTGVISGTGSISKIGRGELVLRNANTYTRGTTIERGKLVLKNVTGSVTGSGPVTIKGGTLSGVATVAGAVTVGTGDGKGALLAPGGKGRGSLDIQSSLTLNTDASHNWAVNSNRVSATQVAAKGVTISGAEFSYSDLGNSTISSGTVFTVINDTAATPIAGTFSNLPDGGTIAIGSNTFQADYKGGDGNDLTLTVVP